MYTQYVLHICFYNKLPINLQIKLIKNQIIVINVLERHLQIIS